MPIYEFKCKDCGEEFEALLKSKEELSSLCCKACGSKRIERLLSVVNSLLGKGEAGPKKASSGNVETYSCPTGTCSHLQLPGHQK